MSGNFYSSVTIQSYARQLNILTYCTTSFGVYEYLILKNRIITDWLVENVMLFNVSASQKHKKRCHKYLISIRLHDI